ncbi:hypothetical protein E2C01_001590 [Portunus trituberculatus]|uniref:Uncharacterized protein n=1 Tax=Portunus trituberculatus TaxID=210409 RepID=A0A5B7CJN2_PORTR|nr:hypothetical protein [Portunus trituberculatus]
MVLQASFLSLHPFLPPDRERGGGKTSCGKNQGSPGCIKASRPSRLPPAITIPGILTTTINNWPNPGRPQWWVAPPPPRPQGVSPQPCLSLRSPSPSSPPALLVLRAAPLPIAHSRNILARTPWNTHPQAAPCPKKLLLPARKRPSITGGYRAPTGPGSLMSPDQGRRPSLVCCLPRRYPPPSSLLFAPSHLPLCFMSKLINLERHSDTPEPSSLTAEAGCSSGSIWLRI